MRYSYNPSKQLLSISESRWSKRPHSSAFTSRRFFWTDAGCLKLVRKVLFLWRFLLQIVMRQETDEAISGRIAVIPGRIVNVSPGQRTSRLSSPPSPERDDCRLAQFQQESGFSSGQLWVGRIVHPYSRSAGIRNFHSAPARCADRGSSGSCRCAKK